MGQRGLTVCVVGRGPIARTVVERLAGGPVRVVQMLLRAGATAPFDVPAIDHAGAVAADLVSDCAGVEGLAAHGPALLLAGRTVVTLSAAAFADAALSDRLMAAAERGGGRVLLAPGAIGAVDALAAAREGGLTSVRYTGRKPPAGWAGTPAAAQADLARLDRVLVHFEGNARDAALAYPKNANVAATVALAGIGFEATAVRLIADPFVQANTHTLEADGAFGHFEATFEARSLPGNPRSSALAAMSMVRTLLGEAAALRIV